MSQHPLILGHRGASAVAPENTLAAFSRAIAAGADGIEFDVQLSHDGVPVVIHDASLKRTGLQDRLVSDLTAQELQTIDVGTWFRKTNSIPAFAGERLPLLTDVFDLFRLTGGLLYVEMKCETCDAAALAGAVVRLTRSSGMADRVVVLSFDHSAIAEVKRLDSTLRTAALFEPKLSQPMTLVRSIKVVDKAVRVGADEIALHYSLAGNRVIDQARERGLEVVLWTVDDPKWIARSRKLGVKALIANDPSAMLAKRRLIPV
ncbi:MAG TPA: glycerophosphodiester phosphodiesterase family protein [Pyrinomonadaceae bacterium]|nr:glycerophosphodiester phosphodiesterase family protein [Pyrinomonadaceae bacterium]